MKRLKTALFVTLTVSAAAAVAFAQPPAGKDLLWAFPVASAVVNKAPAPVPVGPQQVAGSDKSYTQVQLDSTAAAVDWFPDQHLPQPTIVRDGQANFGFACGSCHLANGRGHPESADLSGLTAEYIIRTMADLKSAARNDPIRMTAVSKATPESDVREAAAWFASLKTANVQWIKVVEQATVPHTYIGPGRMRFIDPDAPGVEPIGKRVIELPVEIQRVRQRDPRATFIAYAPPGSVAKGKALVSGKGKTPPCALCHGEKLQGLGNVPAIAGTHPAYIARQLYDFQTGARNGADAQLMKGVVAKLDDDDIVALSAYLATLPRG